MSFFHEEIPEKWARWWVLLWAINFVTLVTLAFLLSVTQWAIAATIGFGSMEGVGLIAHRDEYPPLTYVLRHYLPRWATFTLLYGIYGGISASWLGFTSPWRFAALFALLGWMTDHFTVTYSA